MILFIGHEASMTGAPRILLEFCRWLKENTSQQFEFILGRSGPLLDDYMKLAPVYIWNEIPQNVSVLKRVINRFRSDNKTKIIRQIKKRKYELVFNNTVTNGEILNNILPYINCPVVTRVSELESVIYLYNRKGWVDECLKNSDRFIAISSAVAKNLILNHNIPEEKVFISSDFISNSLKPSKIIEKDQQIFQSLNISKNTLIIGACGTLIWRKGPDLFIRVLKTLVDKYKIDDVFFIWLGGDTNSYFYQELIDEIYKFGLDRYIKIIGETTYVEKYYKIFDVFLMTSREEPFGTVNIEAGQFGIPILCFEKSGGPPEFVTDDVGIVVPYADTEAMADKIIELKSNVKLLEKLSENIKKKSENYTIEKKAPELFKIIKALI